MLAIIKKRFKPIKTKAMETNKLIFTNPDTGKEETVITTLPGDMDKIIKGEPIG